MRVLGERLKTSVELIFDHSIKRFRQTLATQLRGGILNAFQDSEFQQHDSNGTFIYRYPRIQYQWRNNNGIIVGWMESAEKLLQLPWLDLRFHFDGAEVRPTDVFLNPACAQFSVSERLFHYRLATPVLLFNQKNYVNYSFQDNVFGVGWVESRVARDETQRLFC